FGEGVYANADDEEIPPRNELFGMMLQAITSRLGRWMLYIEVSRLSHKMFGYREFRASGYFPVRWMNIHNSLHSRAPEERISPRMQQRIDSAYERGVVTDEVSSEADLESFIRLLRQHNWLKPKRYIPDDKFFVGLAQSDHAQLYLTRYRDHIIGCSAVVVSEGQAYLWFAAYRRKTYATLHPDVLTIWHAIKDAHRLGRQHIYFMDVGLPFRKNAFREFILRFGGKPTSTYRWFRCSIRWINALLSWIYRD
ncbi:MAG: GNAT family N-acetyltransferase, partial [Prevotella sp.]|nr:GNAT family N-acetyltransferase [Prevotella sp.]